MLRQNILRRNSFNNLFYVLIGFEKSELISELVWFASRLDLVSIVVDFRVSGTPQGPFSAAFSGLSGIIGLTLQLYCSSASNTKGKGVERNE